MRSALDNATRLAAMGFYVFPLMANGKTPAIEAFPQMATRDPAYLRAWFYDDLFDAPISKNVGIYCGRFGDDPSLSLAVIDEDNKGDKRGADTMDELRMFVDVPETYTQTTPTGGRHYVYLTRVACGNSVQRLGPGVDTRGVGGFIVASGSTVPAGTYTDNGAAIAHVPDDLLSKLPKHQPRSAVQLSDEAAAGVDQDVAMLRFRTWLKTAKRSVKGDGGDHTAYTTACVGRDYGLTAANTLYCMLEPEWDEGCGWTEERLAAKVAHAYKYAKGVLGREAPELEFEPLSPEFLAELEADRATVAQIPVDENGEHPFDYTGNINFLNRHHALVFIGSDMAVMWDTEDHVGRRERRYLSMQAFHARYADKMVESGSGKTFKQVSATKVWLSMPSRSAPPGDGSPWRRTYDGLCFSPERPARPGWLNAWEGFAVQPLAPGEAMEAAHRKAIEDWRHHALVSICGGDEKLCRWYIGWMAHMIQRPWEKPLTAIVLQGGKGSGKTSSVARVFALLGKHGLITHERRYLLGQFNGHFEGLLALLLDEAVWAGEVAANSVLKGIITGDEHLVERKGQETYRVANLTRVAFASNEKWVIPASHDERRYAVFSVRSEITNKKFFESIRVTMENGGYRAFLRYLLDFDLTGIDVNTAPATEGLRRQKEASLDPVQEWWQGCLVEGHLTHTAAPDVLWPEVAPAEAIADAIKRYFDQRRISGRVPNAVWTGRKLRDVCPSIKSARLQGRSSYTFPPLEQARADWSAWIGHCVDWSATE